LLEVKNLVVNYGEASALRGIDLSVNAGATVSLIGANGAGKSTLVRTLMGMQPVTSGTMTFAGEDITGHSGDRPRLGIAIVPEGRRLFKGMSVKDNLRLGLHDPAARKRGCDGIELAYDLFPILRKRSRQLCGTMSGGEQQMVALGRALVSKPRLLILDEPSLGLAPIVVDQVFEVIEAVVRQDVTVLLAEQNIHRALALSDWGYVLADGSVVLEGTGRELLESNQVRSAYLGE
jgi:branched-chain amino acid transport system ATP-binding protein